MLALCSLRSGLYPPCTVCLDGVVGSASAAWELLGAGVSHMCWFLCAHGCAGGHSGRLKYGNSWEEWLLSLGLDSPTDFCYAFASAEEVAEAGGQRAADEWTRLRKLQSLPSTWDLPAREKVRQGQRMQPAPSAAPQPVVKSRPITRRREGSLKELYGTQGSPYDAVPLCLLWLVAPVPPLYSSLLGTCSGLGWSVECGGAV